MLKKILAKTSEIIWDSSISMIIVGGAMLVMGRLYHLGKEIGRDIRDGAQYP